MMSLSSKEIQISISKQELYLIEFGEISKTYKISSSKYGEGSKENSFKTPLGKHEIKKLIGKNEQKGMRFVGRTPSELYPIYDDEEVYLCEEDTVEQNIKLHPNEFVMMVSNQNEKKTAIAKFVDYLHPLQHISASADDFSWGVKPKNKEQKCGFDLLMDCEIPFVSLIGRAGSGKTLMAILAGLEQVLGKENQRYKKIVISRPVQTLGKDIGYLPGTMEEKMAPWMKPIFDNMQFIMGADKTFLEMYLQKGIIEIEALAYIRGRSISDAYVIIDEAQNLTAHEVKTIITRIGENTKIVLTGDIEQIDNVYTNETSNGLTYAVEKFKHSHLSGHVTFKKGERSKLATEASKLL